MLPQSEPPSLRILPAASPKPLEHLNLNPVHTENVPIFCMKITALQICTILLLGGGGFQRGRDLHVAPLWLTSLVTFLFSDKKVTSTY